MFRNTSDRPAERAQNLCNVDGITYDDQSQLRLRLNFKAQALRS